MLANLADRDRMQTKGAEHAATPICVLERFEKCLAYRLFATDNQLESEPAPCGYDTPWRICLKEIPLSTNQCIQDGRDVSAPRRKGPRLVPALAALVIV